MSLILEDGGIAKPVLERTSAFPMGGNVARPYFEAIEFILDVFRSDLGRKPRGVAERPFEADEDSAALIYTRKDG